MSDGAKPDLAKQGKARKGRSSGLPFYFLMMTRRELLSMPLVAAIPEAPLVVVAPHAQPSRSMVQIHEAVNAIIRGKAPEDRGVAIIEMLLSHTYGYGAASDADPKAFAEQLKRMEIARQKLSELRAS